MCPRSVTDSFALLTSVTRGCRQRSELTTRNVRAMLGKWSGSVSSVRCHSQNSDDVDAAVPDPEEGGLVDGQAENECNVDVVKWCGRLRRSTAPVVPFRQRVLAAFSPAARDPSLGSRFKLTEISKHCCGLRTCKSFRITEGPEQRCLFWQQLSRHSLLLSGRDLAALSQSKWPRNKTE